MKKFDFKSMVIGLVIGIAVVSIGFAALQMSKKSADITAKSENISDKASTTDASNNKTNTEDAETTKRIQEGMKITADASNNEADVEAIEIMKKTGNWEYTEKYFTQMSANGIEKVVEIYNSKHMNVSEHKKASDYIKK
ncbi:hypothetical protein [Inconstantimicrobium mannanitabidum]|uniref:Uncharacterized protein n=1 Tax=Inconstantimicrobium mannanitabidum TaxID=1604901 RepID=A0ACB5R6Y8_9CLOT|nr:hypothetical protein [Clostridium sp. TW13]GKX64870.1 hypothetical protein rsdtw13_01280 [Clostridium sp. TW13]